MFSKGVEDLLDELTGVMLNAPELNDPDSDLESETSIEKVSKEDPEDLIDLPESSRELPQLPQMLDVSTQISRQDPTHTSTGRGRSTSRPWLASSTPGPPPANKTKGFTGPVETSTSTTEPHLGATGKRQRQSSSQPPAKRQRRSRKRHRPLPPHIQPLCWNCHGEGHRYSKCPEKTEQGLAKFCRRCGRTGVTLAKCPTCRNQWLRQERHGLGAGRCGQREGFKLRNQTKASENFHQREP